MPSSRLLNELSSVNEDCFHYDNSRAATFYSEYVNIPSPNYDVLNLRRTFYPIKEHIASCQSCNSLAIIAEYNHSGYKRREGNFYLSCSCGEDWILPLYYLTIEYKGMEFQEMIAQINVEIKDENGGKRFFRKFTEIDNKKYDIPLIHRQAITGLEVI